MDFKEIVHNRFAAKKFDGRKIDQHKIDELLELIRLSASSFGLQPYKIKVISDDHTKKLLGPVSWGQPQITTCSHLLVFCANTDILSHIHLLEKAMIHNGATKEGLKGYIDMMLNFEKGLDENSKKTWSQRQSYVALGNAINGAKSLGFDSCPMEGFDPAEYSKILHLPANIIPTAVCALGYTDEKAGPKARMSKEELFF